MGSQKNYVFKLEALEAEALKKLLEERSWEFSAVPYAFYKAAKEGVSAVAYESGKLVVQGAGASDFVEFILEPEILKEKAFENIGDGAAARQVPFFPHAGIDESGKGDFFGPLVVACAFVPDKRAAERLAEAGVKDSKLIKSDAAIRRVASAVRGTLGGSFAVVAMGPEAYNRVYENIGNLNRLLAWGHAQALESLLKKHPECNAALADKFADEHLVRNAFARFKHEDFRLEQRTKAESDIAVAAASILARAEFVRRVGLLEEELGLELPKGAGTSVDNAARRIVVSGGETLLRTVAKMHFRNACKALGLPMPEKKPRSGF